VECVEGEKEEKGGNELKEQEGKGRKRKEKGEEG